MVQLIRSSWLFTTGIVNYPIMLTDNGEVVMGNYPKQNKILPVPDTSKRYFFWELDTLELSYVEHVKSLYREFQLPVLIHHTAKGLHFICLCELAPDTWSELVSKSRYTNTRFPPTTLRVKSNKYINEDLYFKQCWIDANGYQDTRELAKLIQFQSMLRFQQLGLMSRKYFLVRYRIDKPHGE